MSLTLWSFASTSTSANRSTSVVASTSPNVLPCVSASAYDWVLPSLLTSRSSVPYRQLLTKRSRPQPLAYAVCLSVPLLYITQCFARVRWNLRGTSTVNSNTCFQFKNSIVYFPSVVLILLVNTSHLGAGIRLKTLRHLVAALRTVGLVRPRGSSCSKYSEFAKIL